MENASTALKIAGGIIIAMLVLSLIVFGIRRASRYEQQKQESVEVEQLAEFNQSLLSYENDIVSGFRMISLSNLANDNNVRFSSEIDDFVPVRIYAKLINTDGQLPGWSGYNSTDDYKKIKLSTGVETREKYFNMINYVGTTANGPYYIQSNGKATDKKTQTEFKQLYFQCMDVTYDKTTGRVIQMVFDEIKKRN